MAAETTTRISSLGKTALRSADVRALACVAGLVTTAAIVGRVLLARGEPIYAGFPPLQGGWDPHLGWGSLPSVLIAGAVVLAGPWAAARLPLAWLLIGTMVTATGWIVALAAVDGWDVGFVSRLARPFEYLAALPQVRSWSDLFTTFNDHVPIDSANRWPIHVAGHPPGALVPFELLDRAGLQGGAWAAWLCVLLAASSAVALLIVAGSLAGGATTRRVAPFTALAPGAVWLGVSADALFTAFACWAIACLAVATRAGHAPQLRVITALLGGALLASGIYLSYGLVLVLPIAATLLIARGRLPTVAAALVGFTTVVGAVSVLGFTWWTGYHVVVERYHEGLGGVRPYGYWVWANVAAFALACGPAVVVGTRRVFRNLDWTNGWVSIRRSDNTLAWIVLATLGAVFIATVGGLSKAEVERIWLPFGTLLLLVCAWIPIAHARTWLASQALLVLALQHLLMTPW